MQTKRAAETMWRLHGTDIYAGFVPTFPLDLQGWNSRAPVFREIVEETRTDTVVDVGTWKGASTIYLAELMKEREIDGVVVGVDTFLGSVEHSIPGGQYFDLLPRQFGRPMLYEQFLSNVLRSNAQDRVVPLAHSAQAGAALIAHAGLRPGLIHIDAAHDYESVMADANAFWAILAPGGYLVGDDYSVHWPEVIRAADEFAKQVGAQLRVSDPGPKWTVRKA